jgi:Flp pilus assembly protein TadD
LACRDVFLDGRKMITEHSSISGGRKTNEPENQYQYNLRKSDEAAYKKWYNQNQYYLDITKGDKLKGEGRYDEAIHFYDEAINSSPNDFQNWKVLNSKGEALYKQGEYEEALQAYDKAIELAPDVSIVWTSKGYALKALGRTNESDVAFATARELGDQSAMARSV